MTLFFSAGSCSLASRIVLLEAGFNFDSEKVDLRAKTFSGGNYREINPKGSVPALKMDNGEILTEGAVILQYVSDLKPESGLMPKAGTVERYRAQEWLNFVASDLHKTFSILWAADRMVTDPTGNEQLKNAAKETLGQKFDFLNSKLQGQKYLMGDKMTAPDAYCYTILRWSGFFKIDLSPYPELSRYFQAIEARPLVDRALVEEGIKK